MKANPWLDEQNAKFNQSRDLVAIADHETLLIQTPLLCLLPPQRLSLSQTSSLSLSPLPETAATGAAPVTAVFIARKKLEGIENTLKRTEKCRPFAGFRHHCRAAADLPENRILAKDMVWERKWAFKNNEWLSEKLLLYSIKY
ncbi:uncharacterized protein LOC125199212 [Salvia hispanica]|uniref:uncharacterized protein LOC125199212 n=1 Tax=Salvia hispanica TaxID=49212 RepID=UPI002009BEEC|nr:uncharacterized protein LOC125199212 [Salvia hispanica]